MAHRRGSALLVAPVLVLSLFLAGCPKRPATTAASAPPPTGAPSAAAPSTGETRGGSPMTPSAVAPATAAPSTTPPAPSEFRETDNLKDVFFDFDKYDIRPADARMLDTNAA